MERGELKDNMKEGRRRKRRREGGRKCVCVVCNVLWCGACTMTTTRTPLREIFEEEVEEEEKRRR
jgi:hypothetical protein